MSELFASNNLKGIKNIKIIQKFIWESEPFHARKVLGFNFSYLNILVLIFSHKFYMMNLLGLILALESKFYSDFKAKMLRQRYFYAIFSKFWLNLYKDPISNYCVIRFWTEKNKIFYEKIHLIKRLSIKDHT